MSNFLTLTFAEPANLINYMIFAILFVVAFLIGLAVYQFSDQWIMAVLVSTGLFVVTTLADTSASDHWGITFVFGLPIVFVASLFGAYVVQLRRGEDDLSDVESPSVEQAASKIDDEVDDQNQH